MKALVIAAALAFGATAYAGPGGPNGPKNHSGADDFRDVVVQCMVAGLQAGAVDPVALAAQCIQATQDIWAASYPTTCIVVD